MISRRSLFLGSAAVILTPGVLMPVRKVWVPESSVLTMKDLTRRYIEMASARVADLRHDALYQRHGDTAVYRTFRPHSGGGVTFDDVSVPMSQAIARRAARNIA